jgi:hypothetical protein
VEEWRYMEEGKGKEEGSAKDVKDGVKG